MTSIVRPALVIFVVLTALTGVAYPLLVTGIAQAAFADKATGSLIVRDGKPIGIEMTAPEKVSLTKLNRVLRDLGLPAAKRASNPLMSLSTPRSSLRLALGGSMPLINTD